METPDLPQALLEWASQLREIHVQNPDMVEEDGLSALPESLQLEIQGVYSALLQVFGAHVPLPKNLILACVEKALDKVSVGSFDEMDVERATEVADLALIYLTKAKRLFDARP